MDGIIYSGENTLDVIGSHASMSCSCLVVRQWFRRKTRKNGLSRHFGLHTTHLRQLKNWCANAVDWIEPERKREGEMNVDTVPKIIIATDCNSEVITKRMTRKLNFYCDPDMDKVPLSQAVKFYFPFPGTSPAIIFFFQLHQFRFFMEFHLQKFTNVRVRRNSFTMPSRAFGIHFILPSIVCEPQLLNRASVRIY